MHLLWTSLAALSTLTLSISALPNPSPPSFFLPSNHNPHSLFPRGGTPINCTPANTESQLKLSPLQPPLPGSRLRRGVAPISSTARNLSTAGVDADAAASDPTSIFSLTTGDTTPRCLILSTFAVANWTSPTANTQTIPLIPDVAYVFGATMDTEINKVAAWHDEAGDGKYGQYWHIGPTAAGKVAQKEWTVGEAAASVHFEMIMLDVEMDVAEASGTVALYAVPPGVDFQIQSLGG